MANLSERLIQKLCNPKSYERGEKYYQQGRVTDYIDRDNELKATVVGTGHYQVEINLSNLDMFCDCPAFGRIGVCKHLVAVMLTKLHGEIKPAKPPKIKHSGQTVIEKTDFDLKPALKSLSKAEMAEHIQHLASELPQVCRYFVNLTAPRDKAFYKAVEKRIRQKINSINRRVLYDSYWHRQRDAVDAVRSEISLLPFTKSTAEFLLRQGYWITEKMTEIDDSNGVLNELISEIIEKSVSILDKLGTEALDIFYEYTGKESSFDYHIGIVDTILGIADDPHILEEITTKLERTQFKEDNDFGFERSYGLHSLMSFYLVHNPSKYEDLAMDLMENDFMVKLNFIEFLSRNKRHEEVLKYGWDMRDHFDINELIEKALLELNETDKLIEFYKESILDKFDKEQLKRFRQAIGESKKSVWDEFIDALLNSKLHLFDRLRLLVFLQRYDDFYKLLCPPTQHGHIFYKEMVEDYAVKFTIIHPETSVKLYRYLLEAEIDKMKTSNHYKHFALYYRELKELGDTDYLSKTKQTLKSKHPTKKKLMKMLGW